MLIRCPMCGWEKQVKDELEGRDGECRKCGEVFTLKKIVLVGAPGSDQFRAPEVAESLEILPPPELPQLVAPKSPPVTIRRTARFDGARGILISGILFGAVLLFGLGYLVGQSALAGMERELSELRLENSLVRQEVVVNTSWLSMTRDEVYETIQADFPEFKLPIVKDKVLSGLERNSIQLGLNSFDVIGQGQKVRTISATMVYRESDSVLPARIAMTIAKIADPEWGQSDFIGWYLRASKASGEQSVTVSERKGEVELTVVSLPNTEGQLNILTVKPAQAN